VSDGVSADNSELDRLVADLGSVPKHAGRNVTKALEVGARNVKDGWREKISHSRGVPHGAASISYDIEGDASVAGSTVSAEIGPELEGQGPIVGLIEMGTVTLAPHGYGLAALKEEQPDFEKGLDKAIDDALKAAGL